MVRVTTSSLGIGLCSGIVIYKVPAIVQPGETLSSTHYERRSGGKGANQAVAVSKAGASVTLVGAVGSDGDWVVNGLKQIGVDVGSIVVSENVRPTALSPSLNSESFIVNLGTYRKSDHSAHS